MYMYDVHMCGTYIRRWYSLLYMCDVCTYVRVCGIYGGGFLVCMYMCDVRTYICVGYMEVVLLCVHV